MYYIFYVLIFLNKVYFVGHNKVNILYVCAILGYGREVAAAGGEANAEECSTCYPSRSDAVYRGKTLFLNL